MIIDILLNVGIFYLTSVLGCTVINQIVKNILYKRFMREYNLDNKKIKDVFNDYFTKCLFVPVLNMLLSFLIVSDLDSTYENVLDIINYKRILRKDKVEKVDKEENDIDEEILKEELDENLEIDNVDSIIQEKPRTLSLRREK